MKMEKTMQMTLIRTWSDKNTTLGKLYIDGAYFCRTLEDEFRAIKVKNETRIPCGTYGVIWTYSNRFSRDMLLLEKVPGFEGIRIHSGNTDKDTSGCLLVGEEVSDTMLLKSKMALTRLELKVVPFAINKKLSITILDHDLK